MPVKSKLTYANDGEIIDVPVHTQPHTTVTRNRTTGAFEEVPTASINDLSILGGCVDLASTGLGVSKTVWTDTYKHSTFTFRLRYVGKEVLLADDTFLDYTLKELKLEELAAEYQDFSGFPDPDAARLQGALALFTSQGYRVHRPDLSRRADELVAERYEQVLIGLDPEGDDPDKWGGLVGWIIDGIAPSKFPFSFENVRKLNLQTKAMLYGRLLTLTREGASDAQFRQSRGL
ncbi:hypothetical protein EON83_27830 [bacterium]|nr:MAG: hypothetical protein EON83_27830 [bacterium]